MPNRYLNMYLAHKKWETIKFEKEIQLLSCQEIKLKIKDISITYGSSEFFYLETQQKKIQVLEKWYNSMC